MRDALGGPPDKAFASIREWIGALMMNSTDLLGEADLLFDAKKYARALALAHFAMEEMGKVVSLMSLAVELAIGSEPDWPAAEKAWSSHNIKFQLFHVVDLVTQATTAAALSGDLGLLEELELRLAGRPLREMSLYVDIEDGVAQLPSARFPEDLAKLYLGTAFHTGKILIDVLPTAGERLEMLATELAEPKTREKFGRAKAEFELAFAAARSKAKRQLMHEFMSEPNQPT
jgi:AbiV family abortive infection protein